MATHCIDSRFSINNFNNSSGINSTQGIYKGKYTISSESTKSINTLSINHDFPKTSLPTRNTTISHPQLES